MPEYRHTQYGYLHYIFYAVLFACLPLFWPVRHDPQAMLGMTLVGAVFLAIAWTFSWLRIEDGGDRLRLRYGPLPLFWKSFRYADMAQAEPGRITFSDGWGIHWTPGRGWTYNLWGFGCVVVHLRNGRTVRIGTDEPGELAEFLETKIRLSRKVET